MDAVPGRYAAVPTSRTRVAVLVLASGLLGLAACASPGEPTASGASSSPSKAEFAAQADRICLETASHFSELPDPDGEGGAKPLGLGGFMRDWVARLRSLDPPPEVARDWRAALDLLDRAADALDAAEAGDPEAQSEALWNLEPRAAKRIEAMHVPFRVCFVE